MQTFIKTTKIFGIEVFGVLDPIECWVVKSVKKETEQHALQPQDIVDRDLFGNVRKTISYIKVQAIGSEELPF